MVVVSSLYDLPTPSYENSRVFALQTGSALSVFVLGCLDENDDHHRDQLDEASRMVVVVFKSDTPTSIYDNF